MKVIELFEDVTQLSVLVKLVRRDCKDFLSQADQPLYRGLKETSGQLKKMGPDLYKGTVRKDRKPKDLNQGLHAAFNDGIKKHFGINKIRERALFCTFRYAQAMQFGIGAPFIIFPIGKFDYIWSPFITDPWSAFQDEWGSWDDELSKYIKQTKDELDIHKNLKDASTEEIEEIVDHLLDKFGNKIYTDKDIKGAQSTKNEIMVLCDTFYAISVETLDAHYDTTPHELMKAIHESK